MPLRSNGHVLFAPHVEALVPECQRLGSNVLHLSQNSHLSSVLGHHGRPLPGALQQLQDALKRACGLWYFVMTFSVAHVASVCHLDGGGWAQHGADLVFLTKMFFQGVQRQQHV